MTTSNVPAVQQKGALALANVGANYIAEVIQAKQSAFLEVNEGLDFDYVRMGQYLKINKKGNFVESRDDTVSYGETLDVVVAQGETRWVLWGGEETAEEGQLIVSLPAKEELLPEESVGLTKVQIGKRMVAKAEATARATLDNWLATTAQTDPSVLDRYEQSDLQLRYLAYIVPVKFLNPEDSPKIYLMNFAPGDTFGWGQYGMSIFDGKFKSIGVPANSSAKHVVTRFTTAERSKDKTSWLGIDFTCLGLFNPADYGIDPSATEFEASDVTVAEDEKAQA
jgi:hypothetical protein